MRARLLILALAASCSPAAPVPAAEDAIERTVLGQTLLVTPHPVRVLAGNVGTLELALGLIDLKRFAAVPAEGYEYSILGRNPERIDGMPKFPVFDAESILAAEPDLVLASDWQSFETISATRAAGLPVLRIPTPSSWEQLDEILLGLGVAFDAEQEAAALVLDLAQRREALAKRTQPFKHLRAMAYSNFGTGGATAGKGSTWDLIMQAAGVRNAATEVGIDGHEAIDLERLMEINPEFLLLSEDVGGDAALEDLRSLPEQGGLEALKTGSIMRMPSELYASSSQHMLDAAELLVQRLEALQE
jgi:iron complex transport system substrate-binding protein